MSEQRYISIDAAVKELGISKGTFHYYLRKLKLNTMRFPLDKRAYLTLEDYQQIKTLKDQAKQRGSEEAA